MPRARREIISLCRNVSYEHRDYIVFILTEVPSGIAQTRLANLVTQIKPFGRRVSVTVAPHARTLSAYNGIGIHAIGLDLQEYQRGDAAVEEDAKRLAGVAVKAGLRSFAVGVHDARSLIMVHDAGIHYLCGNAVLPPCSEPPGVRRLTWEELIDHALVVN